MGGKGNSRHLKSLATSRYAAIHKKAHGKYFMKPGVGRHSLDRSVPLSEILQKAGSTRDAVESKRAITMDCITVNGRVVKEPKYPVGLNDVVGIIPSNKQLQIGINERGQIEIKEIPKGEKTERICKVVGKYLSVDRKMVIRLHDGANFPMGSAKINVNDSVVINEKNAIGRVLPMAKASACLVIDGVHVGTRGKILDIKGGNMHKSASAVIARENGESFETLVKNLMVIS